MALEDEIAAERARREQAYRQQTEAERRDKALREWMADRLYASPNDPKVLGPPEAYADLVAEIVKVVSQRFWYLLMRQIFRDKSTLKQYF